MIVSSNDDPAAASRTQPVPRRSIVGKRSPFSFDKLMALVARLSGVTILLLLVILVVMLTWAAWPSIQEFGFGFVVESEWRPNELEVQVRGDDGKIVFDENGEPVIEIHEPVFGALPVIYGTVVSSLIALIIAVPLGFGTALFLVRSCPKFLATPVSFLVEFLAAIPSIAYGMWGLFVLAPFLQDYVEPGIRSMLGWIPFMNAWLFMSDGRELPLTGRDMFCGGLVLSIMILPIITAVSRDVLKTVPRAQIEGTLALGATWWQSSWEMLRYSRSALFGAVMLGLGRAAGETMAVTMVIGNARKINSSLFAPAQTMSSLLANEFAEASSGLHRAALTEVALILLLMSLVFSLVARWLVVGGNSRTAAAH
jgi:phosphate transport system permease protein